MSRKGVEEAIKCGGCPDPRGLEDGRHEGWVSREDELELKKLTAFNRDVCVYVQVARRLKVNGHKWFRNLDGL